LGGGLLVFQTRQSAVSGFENRVPIAALHYEPFFRKMQAGFLPCFRLFPSLVVNANPHFHVCFCGFLFT
ncbi:MAG: hypothetical protein IJF59_02440, partial [Clostridia bacterium]|nr:hypothetical protein [Clostridia bacterium]